MEDRATISATSDVLDGVEADRGFTDPVSGKTMQRPALSALLRFVRDGDTVLVHSMDRMARNLDDLRRLVRELTGRGVRVEFVSERRHDDQLVPVDVSDPNSGQAEQNRRSVVQTHGLSRLLPQQQQDFKRSRAPHLRRAARRSKPALPGQAR